MGTSSLYKGPKSSVLLPSDYDDGEDMPNGNDGDNADAADGNAPEEQNDGAKKNDEQKEEEANEYVPVPNATTLWRSAKRSYGQMSKSANPNVRPTAKRYVKALGGYKNAARQTRSARRATSSIITLFGGDANSIKRRLNENGILTEGRSTQDIFNDIYAHLATDGATREDSIVNRALTDTFSDLYQSDIFTADSLDIFDNDILTYMVSHFVKHEIYLKLIEELSYGTLGKDLPINKIKELEKSVKNYVGSIVESVVPQYINDNLNMAELGNVVMELYSDCYKVMEGMANE